MNRHLKAALCISFLVASCTFASGNNYKNFDVATYAMVRDVLLMNDPAYLDSHWDPMTKYVKYNKIDLETSRDRIIADQASLDGTETRDPVNNLYVYDRFIIESFRQDPIRAVVVTDKRITQLRDLQSGQLVSGDGAGRRNQL